MIFKKKYNFIKKSNNILVFPFQKRVSRFMKIARSRTQDLHNGFHLRCRQILVFATPELEKPRFSAFWDIRPAGPDLVKRVVLRVGSLSPFWEGKDGGGPKCGRKVDKRYYIYLTTADDVEKHARKYRSHRQKIMVFLDIFTRRATVSPFSPHLNFIKKRHFWSFFDHFWCQNWPPLLTPLESMFNVYSML